MAIASYPALHRPRVDHRQEGTNMNTYHIGFGWLGKFAVVTALGATLAGGVAIANANATPSLTFAAHATTAEVVRLDPVTVTISRARFDAIQAEEKSAARTAVAHR